MSRKGDIIMNRNGENSVRFEIIEEIGVITTHTTGWAKELNLVSWNGGTPKYDIRDWSPSRDRMSRGMTFTEEDMRRILELFRKRRGGKRAMSSEAVQVAEPAVSETVDTADVADAPDGAVADTIAAEESNAEAAEATF